jgi:hypothetical protein
MTYPSNASDVYDALRQSIYDCLDGRVRPMSVVLHEAKQEAQDFYTTATGRCLSTGANYHNEANPLTTATTRPGR